MNQAKTMYLSRLDIDKFELTEIPKEWYRQIIMSKNSVDKLLSCKTYEEFNLMMINEFSYITQFEKIKNKTSSSIQYLLEDDCMSCIDLHNMD